MHTNRGYVKNMDTLRDKRKETSADAPQKRRQAKKKFKTWSRKLKG